MMWNEHGLGSADYVWWMRIMWRLHSCTMRGLCDNSRNWTHRFHMCATWNDLITAASGKSSLGRFNDLSIRNQATEQNLAPCDNNWSSGTFLRRHVSRDEQCWSFDVYSNTSIFDNSITSIVDNSFWLIADANKCTEHINKTYHWWSYHDGMIQCFSKFTTSLGKLRKLLCW